MFVESQHPSVISHSETGRTKCERSDGLLLELDMFGEFRSTMLLMFHSLFCVNHLKMDIELRKERGQVCPSGITFETLHRLCGFLFQDILENEDLHLDDMFIASLVFDLIKVESITIFLASSFLNVHLNNSYLYKKS